MPVSGALAVEARVAEAVLGIGEQHGNLGVVVERRQRLVVARRRVVEEVIEVQLGGFLVLRRHGVVSTLDALAAQRLRGCIDNEELGAYRGHLGDGGAVVVAETAHEMEELSGLDVEGHLLIGVAYTLVLTPEVLRLEYGQTGILAVVVGSILLLADLADGIGPGVAGGGALHHGNLAAVELALVLVVGIPLQVVTALQLAAHLYIVVVNLGE